MAPIRPAVYATLLTSDSYLPGALVLAHSLRDNGAKGKLVVLVTLDTVSTSTVDELKTTYDEVISVNQIVNKAPANLYLMDRPDLIATFTKIELWKQTQYSRIVYIDSDVVALRAPNELLNLETEFAAVPDIGWPDCFNSGLMVLNPNMGDYYSLLALAQRGISFDGADQGLLNTHFRNWERLSFIYNCTPSGNYQYVPAYRHFQSSINLIHFIGREKPWVLGRYAKQTSGVYDELLGRWWAVYDKHFRPTTAQFSGQSKPSTVQNYVKGEAPTESYGYSSQTPTIQVQSPSPTPQNSGEYQDPPHGQTPEPHAHVESSYRAEPTPTRPYESSAYNPPMMEWDASRAPPPTDARPEAVNFPTQVYTMSSDNTLFEAPTQYPEPPKNMWYEVPQEAPKPEKIAPIFPWETRAPKPTRVFPKEAPTPPPVSEPEPEPAQGAGEVESEYVAAPSTITDDTRSIDTNLTSPTVSVHEAIPWQAFNRTNAWDDLPEIGRYVDKVQRNRNGKGQVIRGQRQSSEPLLSPTSEGRRPSFRLTDFPTELERPSLPVTPAPIRKGSNFWGEERGGPGQLPVAEGVPTQEEWVSSASIAQSSSLSLPYALTWRCQYCGKQNPVTRLEVLQKLQSEVLERPAPQVPEIPKREMPESVSREAAETAADKPVSPPTEPPRPTFAEPTYSSSSQTKAADSAYDPPPPLSLTSRTVRGI